MLIILFILGLGLVIWPFIYVAYSRYNNWDDSVPAIASEIIGGLVLLCSTIAFLVLGSTLVGEKGLDLKLQMHEEENARIELAIKTEIQTYMQYEHDTYIQIGDDEDVEILVIRYPELHSNELVQQQLQILKENNQIIRQLKIEKIDLIKVRWWLYFGK